MKSNHYLKRHSCVDEGREPRLPIAAAPPERRSGSGGFRTRLNVGTIDYSISQGDDKEAIVVAKMSGHRPGLHHLGRVSL